LTGFKQYAHHQDRSIKGRLFFLCSVANGTYNANMDNRITLTEGKSIYGGYSSDYQLCHPVVYPTVITDFTDLSMGVNYEVTPVLIDGNTTRESNPALKSRKA